MIWLMRCRPDYEIAYVTTLSPPITDLIHAAYAKDDTVLFCYEPLLVKSIKTRPLSCRYDCVQAYIKISSIKSCNTVVQMRLTRREYILLVMRISSIAFSVRRMTPPLIITSVVKRPMAWYYKAIGGSNCISGSAHVCLRLNGIPIRRRPWLV